MAEPLCWKNTTRYSIREDSVVFDTVKGKVRPTFLRNGYLCVRLNDGAKYRNEYLHRLLGIAFIPNPKNLPCINHIDGDKLNNSLDNLEWCSFAENIWHRYNILPEEKQGRQRKLGNYKGFLGRGPARAVRCIETGQEFPSISECERRTGIKHTTLCEHLSGRNKTCAGFHWEYIKNN